MLIEVLLHEQFIELLNSFESNELYSVIFNLTIPENLSNSKAVPNLFYLASSQYVHQFCLLIVIILISQFQIICLTSYIITLS